MKSALLLDLNKLKSRAFYIAEWTEETLRLYHAALPGLKKEETSLFQRLYDWIFVPPTLWPFPIQEVLADCLNEAEKGKPLNPRLRLLIELLPQAPDENICAAVARHEFNVVKGCYDDVVRTDAKFSQNELAMRSDPQLHDQWSQIKTAFKIKDYQDHKGVVRRTMGSERNMRPSTSLNLAKRGEVFQATFDAFCLRWNLYGMQNDEPLLLKLAVNVTPYGTMILIPSYWSFDPKRDIRWDAIASLHRTRVKGRQGAALGEGLAERRRAAKKLRQLDKDVVRLGLKGEKKHNFLCAGLGWVPETSPRRISRLRTEFENKPTKAKAK